jgi:arylsulfatase A-like enzyme
MITGLHSHKNGFIDNRSTFDGSQPTMPKMLQAAGYQTAVVGKWHLVSYPTGFDYWKVLPGQGVYAQPRLISMNRDTATYPGYATDVITNEALDWLQHKRNPDKPFLLLLHHKAPHRNFLPKLKYLQIYHTKKFPEPATLYLDRDTAGRGSGWKLQMMSILRNMTLCSDLKVNPDSLMDTEYKPDQADINNYRYTIDRIEEPERSKIVAIYAERGHILRKYRPKGNALLKWKFQWYLQDYLACVASVDENVGRVLDYLDKSGLAKNTLVVYTGDQGFYMGQNGWFDKRWMYDQSMRSPLLIRWPGHIPAHSSTSQLVQNIDYAPTFLDVAGVTPSISMHGISLKKLLEQPQTELSRKSLYYHYYEYPLDHAVLPHIGVRTERYKLIYFYTVKEWQLFDLQKDKAELSNLANLPAYHSILRELKKELVRLRDVYDDHEAESEPGF